MTIFVGTSSAPDLFVTHPTSPPKSSASLFSSPTRSSFLCALQNAPQPCDYSEKTMISYYHWCARFWEYYQEKGVIPTSQLQELPALQRLCNEYIETLNKTALSPSSIAQARASMGFLQRCTFPKSKRKEPSLGRPSPSNPRTRALSAEQLNAIFRKMDETTRLAAMLMYSSGLRLFEVLRMRMRDLDLNHMTILIRDSRGKPGRVVKLARDIYDPLMQHLRSARWRYQEEMRAGLAAVRLPARIRRMQGAEAYSWNWRYVFMGLRSPLLGGKRDACQDHMHESTIQKSLQKAAQVLSLGLPLSCSNLRASFVEHLLEAGYPSEKVRQLCVQQELSWDQDTNWFLPAELAHIPSPLDLWRVSPSFEDASSPHQG